MRKGYVIPLRELQNSKRFGGEGSLINFEEKYNKLEDTNSQQNALIYQLKYHKFVLKSKCDGTKRFQQTVQGRAYSLSELKENLLHIVQYSEDDDPQPILNFMGNRFFQMFKKSNIFFSEMFSINLQISKCQKMSKHRK